MSQIGEFILNHWTLVGGLLIILILIWLNELLTARKQAQSLSPQELVNLINHDKVKLCDLRQKEVFNKGHIIDATKVNPNDFNQPHMEKFKEQPIVLICDSGIQSTTLGTQLKQKGFNQVKTLKGGMKAWTEAGLPLIKE